jgi:predicted esterase
VGLACEFRTTLIHGKPLFPMVAVHGDQDQIIKLSMAQNEITKLKDIGIEVDLHIIPEVGHEITTSMGKTVETILERYGKRSL